jgi:hypothetical protein
MSKHRTIITTGLVALAAAASLLAEPAHAAASTSGPLAARPLNIAAIGDSFASGQGDKGSGSWLNADCYLSSLAAPQQAVALLEGVRPTTFTSAACNGAVIVEDSADPADGDVNDSLLGTLGPNGQPLNNGQLSYIDPTGTDPVDALTISIGGNDIGFASIVTNCANPFDNCTTDPNVTGIMGYGTVQSALQRLGPYPTDSAGAPTGRLGELVKAVNARQDIDNVFLTGYPDPTIAPDGSPCGAPGPYAGFGGFDYITQPKTEWASAEVIAPLNAALAATVTLANEQPEPHPVWHFVDDSGAFNKHGFCDFDDRYVNTPSDSVLEQGDQNGAMHPNNAGQMALAGILFQDYTSLPLLSVSVSAPSTPVVGSQSNLTVQTLNFDNQAIPNVGVWVAGNFEGYTNQSGDLPVSYTFSSTGDHTIVARTGGFPEAQTVVPVQTRPYVAASNPAPIMLGTVQALTLSAVDTTNNQLVAGTFTLYSGSGSVAIRSGSTVDNVVVAIRGYATETVPGPDGKPVTIKVPICPSLSFQPDSPDYAPQNFSTLLKCIGA